MGSYDEIIYRAGAISGAHPAELAVAGIIWGMEPPPVSTCSVLELGCGTGENLIPLAVALPKATLYGIDASARQIEIGRARAAELGLDHVRLETRRIEELTTGGGSFDYIICHGVFSWVPHDVQERMLALCDALLAPNGLAYISYNTLPGWHLRQRLREMLLYHIGDYTSSEQRLMHARSLLEFLTDALRERDDEYGRTLRREVAALRGEGDAYLYHEFLEEDNTPIYFHEFVSRAGAHNLRYVGDVSGTEPQLKMPDSARAALAAAVPDRITGEQYDDFLRGRSFRRTVLCRSRIQLTELDTSALLSRLRLSSLLQPLSAEPDLYSEGNESFAVEAGTLQTNHPALKTALSLLARQYPRALSFADIWQAVQEQLRGADIVLPDGSREWLMNALRQCQTRGFIDLYDWEPDFVLDLSERPRASALARLEAQENSPVITSLWHRHVPLDAFARFILVQLDGTVSSAELLERARAYQKEHRDQAEDGALEQQVASVLRTLARNALLIC